MKIFRTAIVVGASSGIGEAIARQLVVQGTRVALVARREDELTRLASELNAVHPNGAMTFVHDVRDFASAPKVLDQAVAALGGLDILFYAAGVMHLIAESEYAFAKDRETIEVNLLGAMAWMNPTAARFESVRAGTIVGLSSIAGERGRRGNPAYTTSKAALTTYLEALRNRVSRYGVSVVTVKPGYVDTAMTRGLRGLFWLISAEEAARQTLALARRGRSGFVPRRWGLVALVLRMIPSWLFRRLNV